MKINRRERNFLINALVHNWKIKVYQNQNTCHWDEDILFPVLIGNICKGLIKKELLKDFGSVIQSTKLADTFKCKEPYCDGGKLIIYDDFDDIISDANCKKCEGTGVLLTNHKE